ncbi:type IV secretory system conjugative DNA transfer family protein [Rhodopirellula europaea]|uniref:type IV secretory system conjugative DNA transfer family protein n=1 Tax=Rhodopirellula europaea TaxID=1263866 RepID=UPI0030ED0C24
MLFGVNEFDGSPILIPRSALREHVHFLGATGSGKTALGLSPLISQLLDFEDSSVVVVDLKGDDQVLLEEIKKSQRPRKHLTTDMGKGTFGFNLFAQKFWQTLSVANKADLICTGLGLYYGTDYGRSYYSGVNFSLIEAALLKNPEASSFREIYETVCSLKLPGQNISDAAGARIALRRLAQHDILNMGSSLDSNTDLDFESLFQSPEAWFVSLPTSIGSSVNPDIGRLICFSMLAAAKHAQKPRKQVYLVIDEFQRIVSSNLEIILQLARSHEISVILANQSLGDLDTPGSNLLATLATNTRLRQCFSIGDEREMGSVMRAAGEYLIKDTRFNQGSFGLVGSTIQSLSNSFVPSSRLRVNDILAASDSPGSSIFNLRAGAGYAQYGGMSFVAHSVHHIPESEYRRRLNATWPGPDESPYAAQESCVKVEKDAKSVDPVPLPTKEAVQKTATQADADQLQEMFSKLDGGREKNE